MSSNSGNISAFTGTFDVTIGTNTGLIYGASGVAGTITILLSNTGTIDVPSTVTVSIASMSSEVLEQTFTVTGVSVDVMNTENRINFLEAEIASALWINWIYVSITDGTTRRLGLLSKQQRLTTGVGITYQVRGCGFLSRKQVVRTVMLHLNSKLVSGVPGHVRVERVLVSARSILVRPFALMLCT